MVSVTMGFLHICTLQALGFPELVVRRFQRDYNGFKSSEQEIEDRISRQYGS